MIGVPIPTKLTPISESRFLLIFYIDFVFWLEVCIGVPIPTKLAPVFEKTILLVGFLYLICVLAGDFDWAITVLRLSYKMFSQILHSSL